jgi:hypothetical protein
MQTSTKVLLVSAFVLLSGAAFAQGEGGAGGGAGAGGAGGGTAGGNGAGQGGNGTGTPWGQRPAARRSK